MTKKVGRNDPCPCGSGKKYKNCCMKKEQEQATAKYTSSGKRKIKATVLSGSGADQSLGIFGRSATVEQGSGKSDTLEKLKFRMTQGDFQKKESEEPLKFEQSEEKPVERERHLPKPDEGFEPTSEDFREKK